MLKLIQINKWIIAIQEVHFIYREITKLTDNCYNGEYDLKKDYNFINIHLIPE